MKNQDLKYFYTFFLLIILSIGGCKKLPNNGIPSYITLKEPILKTTESQGASVHSFSDIWIESEGSNLGAYEYPITFAAYLAGTRGTICNAGILYNGNGLERRIYPAIEVFDSSYTYVQKDTVEIQPIFRYKNNVNFIYIEDFEATNNFSNLVRTDIGDAANQTGKAGVINLISNENSKTSETITPVDISTGQRVYLEFSLKTENYGGFGIKSVTDPNNQVLLGTFAPFSEWTTIYFSLTNFVNITKEGNYDFYIDVERGDLTGDSKTYIDNFKILQF